ncbi:MAG: hypothetical protein KatS3mg129_2640 [Leptospiraceae bacterium]|nr:MAG: hypothetical protein KatS3mg129_2640 [Leptospiraceae bacterium]
MRQDPILAEKKEMEILISKLRLGLTILYIPAILQKVYFNIIPKQYLALSFGVWFLVLIYSLIMFYYYKKNNITRFSLYISLLIDFISVYIATFLLSYFQNHQHSMFDSPLNLIIFILVGISTLRLDMNFAIGSILLALIYYFIIFLHDIHYFPFDLMLSRFFDYLMILVVVSTYAIVFISIFKKMLINNYRYIDKTFENLSFLLKLSKKNQEINPVVFIHSSFEKLYKITEAKIALLYYNKELIAKYDKKTSKDLIEFLKENKMNLNVLKEKVIPYFLRFERLEIISIRQFLEQFYPYNKLYKKFIENKIYTLISIPIKSQKQVDALILLFVDKSYLNDAFKRMSLKVLTEQINSSYNTSSLLEKITTETEKYKEYTNTEIIKSGNFITKNPQMKEIYEKAIQIARTDIPVLIQGETGTGKELLAEIIHQNSERADRPFIKINCAAIPSELLESELFGYEKGAFTGATTSKPGKFELAHKGTLLLDEIGDMPFPLQAKLLRVLQEGSIERIGGIKSIPIDVRIISATNQDLTKLIEEKKFREDLFYRLNGFLIRLPPLRERKEDIELLIEYFIKEKYPDKKIRFSQDALNFLIHYPWKGNIRELQYFVQRLVTFSDREIISLDIVKNLLFLNSNSNELQKIIMERIRNIHNLKEEIQNIEKLYIECALEICQGNLRNTARLLKIPKSTLFDKIQKYGIKLET